MTNATTKMSPAEMRGTYLQTASGWTVCIGTRVYRYADDECGSPLVAESIFLRAIPPVGLDDHDWLHKHDFMEPRWVKGFAHPEGDYFPGGVRTRDYTEAMADAHRFLLRVAASAPADWDPQDRECWLLGEPLSGTEAGDAFEAELDLAADRGW